MDAISKALGFTLDTRVENHQLLQSSWPPLEPGEAVRLLQGQKDARYTFLDAHGVNHGSTTYDLGQDSTYHSDDSVQRGFEALVTEVNAKKILCCRKNETGALVLFVVGDIT